MSSATMVRGAATHSNTGIQKECVLSELRKRVSEDVMCAIHDCALGISPVTSYSGVRKESE